MFSGAAAAYKRSTSRKFQVYFPNAVEPGNGKYVEVQMFNQVSYTYIRNNGIQDTVGEFG